jgi:glycerol-3-phosphate dehydrogenase
MEQKQKKIQALEIKDGNKSLSDKLYITKNQIHWGVKEEMATNLEDILARRTRCLFLDAYETEKIAPKVAETMAKILNKNQNWINQELKDFKSIIKNYQL